MSDISLITDEDTPASNGKLAGGKAVAAVPDAGEAKLEEAIPQAASTATRRHPKFGAKVNKYDGLAFEGLVKRLEARFPTMGQLVRHYAHDRVCQLFETKQKVWVEVEEEIAEQRELAEARNPVTETKLEQTLAEREAKLKLLKTELNSAIAERDDAERKAAHAFAAVGAVYNPKDPDSSLNSIYHIFEDSNEASAAALGAPYGRSALQALLSPQAWLCLNILSGLVGGMSIGLAVGMLRRSDLVQNPGLVLLWGLGGVGVFTTYRFMVKLTFFQYSEALYLNLPRRAFFGILSLFQLLASIAVWVTVDANGLMKAASNGPEAKPVPIIVSYIVACVLAFGPFLYSANEGMIKGRHDPVSNQVVARTQQVNRERREKLRSSSTFANAATTYVEAEIARRNFERSELAFSTVQQRYDGLIAELESALIPFPMGPDGEQMHRMQHAADQHEWAVVELDAVLGTLLARVRGEELDIATSLTPAKPQVRRPWWHFWRGI